MDTSVAVVWLSHHCYSVKTCLLKIAGPSRRTHNSRAAMHDLSQDCRSEFSQVEFPSWIQDPFGLGSTNWILLFPRMGSLMSGFLRIALPDKDLCSLGGRLCWDPISGHWSWHQQAAQPRTPEVAECPPVDTWSSSRFLIFFFCKQIYTILVNKT